jgi:hypothetical protein
MNLQCSAFCAAEVFRVLRPRGILLTIREQFLIEELRAAISVNAQQGKREEQARLL